MAKKKVEELILELKELFLERELRYLDKLLTVSTKQLSLEEQSLQEELDIAEMKFLKQLKSRLNYVEKLHFQITGKTGKEKSQTEVELMGRIFEMKSSMGDIVRSAEKTGS